MSSSEDLNLAYHDKWNVDGTADWKPNPLIQFCASSALIVIASQARDNTALSTELWSDEVYIWSTEAKLTGNKNDLDKDFAGFPISLKAHLGVGVASDAITHLDKQSRTVKGYQHGEYQCYWSKYIPAIFHIFRYVKDSHRYKSFKNGKASCYRTQ